MLITSDFGTSGLQSLEAAITDLYDRMAEVGRERSAYEELELRAILDESSTEMRAIEAAVRIDQARWQASVDDTTRFCRICDAPHPQGPCESAFYRYEFGLIDDPCGCPACSVSRRVWDDALVDADEPF